VISEGARSQLLPVLISFSLPIFLAPKFSARASHALIVSLWDLSAAFFLSVFLFGPRAHSGPVRFFVGP
jgi:hypothetical protein